MSRGNKGSKPGFQPRIVGFVCNWSAYSGVEMAGVQGTEYAANMGLVRVMCLGRVHGGLVLKAFELGADGVMLLGCPAESCHYEFGMERTREVFIQAKRVLRLLGVEPQRLALVEVPLGEGAFLARQVSSFVRYVSRVGPSPLCPTPRRKLALPAIEEAVGPNLSDEKGPIHGRNKSDNR